MGFFNAPPKILIVSRSIDWTDKKAKLSQLFYILCYVMENEAALSPSHLRISFDLKDNIAKQPSPVFSRDSRAIVAICASPVDLPFNWCCIVETGIDYRISLFSFIATRMCFHILSILRLYRFAVKLRKLSN